MLHSNITVKNDITCPSSQQRDEISKKNVMAAMQAIMPSGL
jgi:hypothetical protein